MKIMKPALGSRKWAGCLVLAFPLIFSYTYCYALAFPILTSICPLADTCPDLSHCLYACAGLL